MNSINNKVLCKPFEGNKKAEANVRSGFATIKQRNNVVSLEVLADLKNEKGETLVNKGNFVNLNESLVITKYTSLSLESKHVQGSFIVVDLNDVIYISEG